MHAASLPNVLSSPEVQAFATGFPILILHLLVTFALLAGAATIYAFMTPWREVTLIRRGNAAAALGFAGVILGLAIPLAVSLAVANSVRDIAVWGVASVVIQLLAFRVVDMMLNGLPQRIERNEISAAVVLVGAKLSTAIILAAALTG